VRCRSSSRLSFDMRDIVWERMAGGVLFISFPRRHFTPATVGRNLASDPHFTGRLFDRIEPDLLFGYEYRGGRSAMHAESPSQRLGQWAVDSPDRSHISPSMIGHSLQTVLARQRFRPVRACILPPGAHARRDRADRNTHLWTKFTLDRSTSALARKHLGSEEFRAIRRYPLPRRL